MQGKKLWFPLVPHSNIANYIKGQKDKIEKYFSFQGGEGIFLRSVYIFLTDHVLISPFVICWPYYASVLCIASKVFCEQRICSTPFSADLAATITAYIRPSSLVLNWITIISTSWSLLFAGWIISIAVNAQHTHKKENSTLIAFFLFPTFYLTNENYSQASTYADFFHNHLSTAPIYLFKTLLSAAISWDLWVKYNTIMEINDVNHFGSF